MKKIALLMICISIMGSSYVSGQKKYQVLAEEDNVLVSYRWKTTDAFKKDSPQPWLKKPMKLSCVLIFLKTG